MSLIKKVFRGFLYLTYLIISAFIILEIIFRFTPTSDSLKVVPVNKDNQVRHYSPNRQIIWQTGSNFSHVVEKKVNNYGFLTDTDFFKEKKNKDIIATIIGDSFVEALQVSNSKSFHGLLQKERKDLLIYPIGISGSQLSTYLAFADFAYKEFNPDIFIFNINETDFDKSLLDFESQPGYHYFNNEGKLVLTNYNPGWLKKILRKSKFLRYLNLDLKLTEIYKKNYTEINQFTEIERRDFGLKVINFFLTGLHDKLKTKKIIFILNADIKSIYKNENEKNKLYTIWKNKLIEESRTYKNIKIIDLHQYFMDDWKLNKTKFDYEYDNHWNEYAHSKVSKILTPNLLWIDNY